MDLFWLKELFLTQGNEKNELYAAILKGQKKPPKGSIEDQQNQY